MKSYDFEEGRKRIEKEDDLVHHRMSWCMSANAFLLAAYSFGDNIDGIVIAVGLCFSISSFISVLAAWVAIWYYRSKTVVSIKKKTYSPIFIALLGSYASICAPSSMSCVWIALSTNVAGFIGNDNLFKFIFTISISVLFLWTVLFTVVEYYFQEKEAKELDRKIFR